MEAVKAQLGTIETERKAAAARLDAAERALAEGARRRVAFSSVDAALAQVSANLGTLDFAGRRKAVEALVETVVAGKDPASWRMEVAIPVDGVWCSVHKLSALWAPEAAISRPRLTCSCPFTSEKSMPV